ncbi:hypothetical protein CR513_46950, partial [Mucuna pruriens]
MELKIKRRNTSRKPYSSFSSWKGKGREKERSRRDKSPKKGNDISQGHITSQCSNRRTMVLRDIKEVESESSCEESSSTSEAVTLLL